MNESTILKCENLTKIYGNEDNKTIALDDVSFSVKKRTICIYYRSIW